MIELQKNNIECMSSVSGAGLTTYFGATMCVSMVALGIFAYVYKDQIKAEGDIFKEFIEFKKARNLEQK